MGEFQGLIDLITMKALYYKTEDLGSTITEADIPEDLLPDAQLWRERMLNSLSDFDEAFTEAFMAHLEGAELAEGEIVAALRRATLTGRAAGPLRLELQVRGGPAAPGRRRRLPAQPARQAAGRGAPPQEGDRGHAPAEPRRALLRAGLQDHQRRPRRPLLRPHLFGPAEGGEPRLQPRAATRRRTARGSTTSAPTTARRSSRHRRRHRRRRRPEGVGHRRHALRRRAPAPAGEDRVPRDRHQHVDRAGELGRQGEALGHPGGPGARGPDLLLQGQRGDRPDPDLGDGGAPPGDPQEPDDPRLQPQGPRRPPPRQLPRDDQAGRQEGAGDLHPPDRRLGALRQGHHRPGARDAAQGGAGPPVRQRPEGGGHPLRVPAGDRGGPSRGGQERRPDRLSRWSTSR